MVSKARPNILDDDNDKILSLFPVECQELWTAKRAFIFLVILLIIFLFIFLLDLSFRLLQFMDPVDFSNQKRAYLFEQQGGK